MPSQVVTYRHRSVSKPMFVVFVLLLLVPTLVAAAAAIGAAFRDGLGVFGGYRALKAVFFFVPVTWLVLKPAGRIVIDTTRQQLRYEPGWPKPALDFPFEGLTAVNVQADAGGSLQRLILRYRDHSERALTEAFSYGRAHHEQVARALNAAISEAHAPKARASSA